MAEQAILDSLLKIISIVLPIITTVVGGFIWVVKRIETGNAKLWKRYRKLSERHSAEMAEVTRQLNLKVDMIQCKDFRSQCSLCQHNAKGVDKSNNSK